MSIARFTRLGWQAAGSCVAVCALACAGSTPKPSTTNDGFVAPMPADAPSPPRPHRGHTRPAAGRELRVIDELVAVAERVRGLKLKRAVPVMVQDADAISDYVDQEIDPDELERARTIYTALDLLDPALDVRALLLRLMAEQIVGYYDTKEARLVVREDVMRAMGKQPEDTQDTALVEARVVLVHELVHALQDQHLGLGEAVERERDTDAENAFRALIEGDAYLAMLGASYEPGSVPLDALTQQPEFRAMLADAFREVPFAGEEELAHAPAIVRVPLLSAYLDGLVFAAALHGEGGWARIDRAHREPPVSTEQVLHPDTFEAGEAPVRMELRGIEGLLGGSGYRLIHEDTLGELEMGVYFAEGTPNDRAPVAADGWGGDRLYAFRPPGNDAATAVVWITGWDSDRDAGEAEYAATRIHASLGTDAKARSLVARSRTSVLIARGLPGHFHAGVRALFERSMAAMGKAAAPHAAPR